MRASRKNIHLILPQLGVLLTKIEDFPPMYHVQSIIYEKYEATWLLSNW